MAIVNCNLPMFEKHGQTLHTWGKDTTGLITYQFNDQGFRSLTNYDYSPNHAFFGSSALFGIGVDVGKTLSSYFDNSHNYGLAGNYINQESIINLENFLKLYDCPNIVFFWVERDSENIIDLSDYVKSLCPNILQISQGPKYPGLINLINQVDNDVSNTHPGPRTHQIWAKTIKNLFKYES